MNISNIFGIGGNSSVAINGKTYVGRNINIDGQRVIVDGKQVTEAAVVDIVINGNVEKIDGACDVKVTGDVGEIDTSSGDISVTGNVKGNVKTTAGDVEIGGNVGGSVKTTAGDITYGGN